jgi:hypothetical protein
MTATKRKKDGGEGEINKAQLIREAFEKHGLDATAKQVQEFCAEKGAKDVAAAQISNVRQTVKGGGGRKRSKINGEAVTASELIQVKALAEKCGGVERAAQLLDILGKLS